ncbi:unnamed protein product [Symbiodinium natans]|uniref:Uncharacterized protein n=1 Tax=Symbiodinium natans TaxID=878477 RepID=A0A812HEE3_9DINO|nr:unnamed protein product [Symbiodinium natans]
MWILRGHRAEELMRHSLTAMGELEEYRSSPLLLECDSLRCTLGEKSRFAIHLDPLPIGLEN